MRINILNSLLSWLKLPENSDNPSWGKQSEFSGMLGLKEGREASVCMSL